MSHHKHVFRLLSVYCVYRSSLMPMLSCFFVSCWSSPREQWSPPPKMKVLSYQSTEAFLAGFPPQPPIYLPTRVQKNDLLSNHEPPSHTHTLTHTHTNGYHLVKVHEKLALFSFSKNQIKEGSFPFLTCN